MKKFTEEDVQLELERISSNIPDEILENLYYEEEANKTIKTVIAKALDDQNFPEEKKDKYRNLLESGRLDGTVKREDEDVREELEEWMEKEIQKSIEAGRLPDRDSELFNNLKEKITNGNTGSHQSTEE